MENQSSLNQFKRAFAQHSVDSCRHSQVYAQEPITLYRADEAEIGKFVPLEQAKPDDNWIEEVQIVKKVLPNHLGKSAPRLSLKVNGIPFKLQQASESDGKHLRLDAFFCAHDVFQHSWSTGLGFINTTTIGGEEATGGIQPYGMKVSSHASPLTDIPTDAIQQLVRLQEQAASSQTATKSAYSTYGDTYTMLDLWAAEDLAKALEEPTIPDGSILTIKIGRPSPDRYFVVDPAYQSRADKPHQFIEYHGSPKILTDYRALKQGEKSLRELLQEGAKPEQVVRRSGTVETTYRLRVPKHPDYTRLIVASQPANEPDSLPQLKEVLYERKESSKTELLTPREFDLILRKVPPIEIAFDETRSLVVYCPKNEFNTAHVFLKETQGDRVNTLEKTRLRYEFYTPMIDRPTGKPYQQSQVLKVNLTLPAEAEPKQVKTKELQEASEHFVKVFKQVEHRRKGLLAGKIPSKHSVGDGRASDPRREAYTRVYETFTKSQDPFDHFLFQILGLRFPKPEQVHLTPRLLPPQE